MQREAGAADEHEDSDDHLDIDAVEGQHARIAGGESSGRDSGEGMAEGLEGSHPSQDQEERLGSRETDIDSP